VQDACWALQLIEHPVQPPFGDDLGALQEVFWLGGWGTTGMPMLMGSTAIPGAVALAGGLMLLLRDAAYAFAP
jgi:hypothetical protein